MITKNSTPYNENDDIPTWSGYRHIIFRTNRAMLEWVNSSKETLELSDMIFRATIDCHKQNIDKMLVVSLIPDEGVAIDVITEKNSFDEMVKLYTQKLLSAEMYERLSEIKSLTESAGLTFPTI